MEGRDRFVLCKGHAAPAQYVALAEAGYFPKEDLMMLRRLGSHLQGHPDSKQTPGVEVCTGSLGQGLSLACGIALGLRLDGGDAGSTPCWATANSRRGRSGRRPWRAAHFRLDNLCAIVDANGLQIDGEVAKVMGVESIGDKFRAFGWHVTEIDGHDMGQILAAYAHAATVKGKPTVIVARTVKGKGVSFFENKAAYHGVTPSDEELPRALQCLGCSDE